MDRKICLDSDVIIEFLRKNQKIKKFLDGLQEEKFYITPISIFEIWSGRLIKEEKMIKDMLGSLIKADFDEDSALKAGDILIELRKKGRVIDFRDLFIASICIINNLELLTLNKKHFERMIAFGLKLIK